MASTYTDNSGIELIGVGEQSGTWGTTTNNNLEIIDKALNGVTDVAVTGDMNIAVSDGDKTSNGHTRVLCSSLIVIVSCTSLLCRKSNVIDPSLWRIWKSKGR